MRQTLRHHGTIKLLGLAMVLVCSLATGTVASQDLTGLYLTWNGNPSSSMTVNWVNLYPRNSLLVHFRELDSDIWKVAIGKHYPVGPSGLQLRQVKLEGLHPDRTYEFGIGERPAKPENAWRFRTMPERLERPVTFVEGGDMMHRREWLDRMNRVAASLEPDFALLGGDLAYENGTEAMRWVDWLQSWMTAGVARDRRLIPMVVAIGNHEVKGGYGGEIPGDAPYYYSLFVPPGTRSFRALDFGNYLSLLVLDSDHTEKIEGAQSEWLEQAIASRSGQQFLFPCYHYPAYGTTKAPEGGTSIDAPRSISIRQNWVPKFERFGVTAVFEHDHHNYKRTVPIRQHRRDDENGLLYLGDGSWGVEVRTVPKPGEAWWLERAEGRNHLWHVELQPAGQVRLRAVDSAGVAFDDLTLPRSRTRPEEPLEKQQQSIPQVGR